MTYIDYLNDFNRWLETNDLPCNSQLMYFKLLHIFNRAGWPKSVQVDNLRMALLIGAESKGTVIRARGKLTAAGFIEFQPGKKGSPNCYRLKKQSQNVTANATVSETNLRESGAIEQDADTVTLLHNPPCETDDRMESPSLLELWLDKNRRGATGHVDATFYKVTGRVTA